MKLLFIKFFIALSSFILIIILLEVVFFFVPARIVVEKINKCEKLKGARDWNNNDYKRLKNILGLNHKKLLKFKDRLIFLGESDLDSSKKYPLELFYSKYLDGYFLNKSFRSILKIRKTGETLYDVEINLNKFGRRGLINRSLLQDRYILFFGDSFIFGEGVNDDETLPYYFSILRPELETHNLGFPSAGINDHLYYLIEKKSNFYHNGIRANKGIIIYSMIGAHFSRMVGSRSDMDWVKYKPAYAINEKKEIEYKGRIIDYYRQRVLLFKILKRSNIIKKLNINLLQFTQSNLELFVKMLAKLKNTYEKKLDDNSFFVLLYPGCYMNKNLILELRKNKIDFFDFSQFDLYRITKGSGWLRDAHPSPLGHKVFAKLIELELESRNL